MLPGVKYLQIFRFGRLKLCAGVLKCPYCSGNCISETADERLTEDIIHTRLQKLPEQKTIINHMEIFN
jgi:hypothetical protein